MKNVWFNIHQFPIQDVQFVDAGSKCPSKFKKLAIGKWPGTLPGCICDNNKIFDKTICDKKQKINEENEKIPNSTISHCTPIEETPKEAFRTWSEPDFSQ